MNINRLVEFGEVYPEPALPFTDYLAGIGRLRLLQCLTHLLGNMSQVQTADRDYRHDMEQLFDRRYNEAEARQVFTRLRAIEQSEGSHLHVLHPKTLLQLFEYGFERPDEADTQTEATLGVNIFKACLALNGPYIALQDDAAAVAKQLMPDEPLAARALAGTFSDSELVNHKLPLVLLMQLIKSVRFFEFLESNAQFAPLLQRFLAHFDCANWQEYIRQQAGFIRPIIYASKPGRIELNVALGPDFASSCAFLNHFALTEGQQLDRADFLSLRATPLYQEITGTFILVYPVLVLETLHKGLYFVFNQLNQGLPLGEQVRGWRSVYCDLFSEQYLLNALLDTYFQGRGLALSGTAIKQQFVLKGEAEPDYYFRAHQRAVLVESKDVLVHKDAKDGHDFPTYFQEIQKKFYFATRANGSREDKAVLQLLRNVRRLLRHELPFDTSYDPAELVIYPVLVVHDRLYNQPGLNVLVNGWFQAELAQLGQQEQLPVQNVRPLVMVDVDTLIAFQDHFRDGTLAWEDVLEAYYVHLNPVNKTVDSEEEAKALVLQSVHPFSLFLENYAAKQGLAPVPHEVTYGLLPIINQGAPEESSEH